MLNILEITEAAPDYEEFVKAKIKIESPDGFEVDETEINPLLKPHQKACVKWAITGGSRAIFASFGLGKTIMQIEVLRIILEKLGNGRALIVAPLGVRQEFKRDAAMLGVELQFIRKSEEVDAGGIYLTNYESLRDGKLDISMFNVLSLDEASILRSFGSKTFSEFLFGPVKDVRFKFVATATPSPNEYQELLAYAHFLGVMDIGQARTRFFKRNSEKSDDLTLHRHKEREFWLWVSSWALFLQKPSDLGYSDEGYDLPEIKIHYHEVPVDHSTVVHDRFGRKKLFREASGGLSDAAKEKRETIPGRIEKMKEILAASPDDNFLIWHDLNAERKAIEESVPGVVTLYGTQSDDTKEANINGFSNGDFQYFAPKKTMAGSGCNFQRFCHKAIFLGIDFKFNDFIQAIHRIHRFLQECPVEIHIIYAESEKPILEALLEKWERDKEQRAIMAGIIKKYGLNGDAMAIELTRSVGVERFEISGDMFRCINNDAVHEWAQWPENKLGLIMTSIPFASQYEYTPSYNDFGHTDDNDHFFAQMDYLTPNLLRVLQPGRLAAVHVKDRIVPGGMTGLGFQVVYPFHCDVIAHFQKHGFAYMGMKTIVTDVVRENNQTYRLSYTEQCKDGSKMGVGMPEYLLIFRKPPTGTENSYADNPVIKRKTDYSLARWQVDAHGFTRSAGDRLLNPDELRELPWNVIYKLYREYSMTTVYDYEEHVRIGDVLRDAGRLPVDFMLLPPQSWHADVWTDITRMLTLNGSQAQKGKQKHICPLQFDIVDRAISSWSMPGEIVGDPFGGIMTVPYRAIKLGRQGWATELNHAYFLDGAAYCEAAEREASIPSLFDLEEFAAEEVGIEAVV